MTALNPITAHVFGFTERPMDLRPATEFEAAKAIAAFRILIDAAENYGNQAAEDRLVKAAKAIGVKVDG